MSAAAPLRLILASASPRRLDLLAQAGLPVAAVRPPDIDETPLKRELPRAYAARLALAKCEAAAAALPPDETGDALVLAADTVVAAGRRILPKAETADEVRACLGLLSGRAHQVLTAVAAMRPGSALRTRLVATRVRFKRLHADEIEAYVAGGEGLGKAGGYAIQGRAAAFVPAINGSYSGVVGLPLAETAALLNGFGFRAEAVR